MDDVKLDDFSKWCLEAKSDVLWPAGVPAPLLTEILYRICDNDVDKFKRVCDILESAYKAGQQSKEVENV